MRSAALTAERQIDRKASVRVRTGILTWFLAGFILAIGVSCLAATPYHSYTYDFRGEAVPGPDVYRPAVLVDSTKLGITLKSPEDLYVSEHGLIYIADTGNNRIVCTDQSWNVLEIIDRWARDGKEDRFNTPVGVFVDRDGLIYVADKNNHRIVILNPDGSYRREIGSPKRDFDGLIPENFTYLPRKVLADRAGRVYVLAQGVYDGLMEFDGAGCFKGFLGAPRVTPNIADYFWRQIGTEAQRERMSLFLPTEYSNFDIDDKGFIYTTVSGGDIREEQAVRRLNPFGEDVLRRNGFFPPVGDVDYPHPDIAQDATIAGGSIFIDVAVQPYGIYSALDQRRGRIFTYDSNGRLLYAFGGLGTQKGLNKIPVAIDAIGENILVLDREMARITVFAPTEYTRHILAAKRYYHTGQYDKASEMWREVLKRNSNFDQAYSGIGRSLLRQDRFAEALNMYRLGNNRRGYSNALRYYRRQVIIENFPTIMTGLVLLAVAIFLTSRYTLGSRVGALIRHSRPGKWFMSEAELPVKLRRVGGSLAYSLHVVLHPFDGFWDLKHEKRGNVAAATIILGLVTVTSIYMRQYIGFVFNRRDLTELNVYMEAIGVIFPFILWCGVNWALTTLVQGKGTIRDIYIYSAFALTPLVLIYLPATIISNYITLEEGAFYYFFLTLAGLWAAGLMFFGTMVTHQFDLKKTFFATSSIVVGMGVVIFIGLLCFSVVAQMSGFINTIYAELMFRL